MCRTDREMAEQRRGPGRPRTRPVEPEQEAGGAGVPWQQMMQKMMQQNQMMAQMMQGMQGQQPPAQAPVPQAAAGPDFRAFFRMDPPEFVGGLDSLLAHDWLAGMKLHTIVHVFGKGKEFLEIAYDSPRFWKRERNS